MTTPINPDLFDLHLQFPEDEFEWEFESNHPTEWWNLFSSWFEYPEDELALFSYEDEPDEATLDSDMTAGDGLSA